LLSAVVEALKLSGKEVIISNAAWSSERWPLFESGIPDLRLYNGTTRT
jgi:hypothetical protein